MLLFSKNETGGGIKKVEPVDKTLTNFENETFEKLKIGEEYCFGRASKKSQRNLFDLRASAIKIRIVL